MTVRLGIVSTARINRLLLAGAAASDALAFVAVASRDAARAQEYARANGLERAYGSYEELLADPEVDGVYISLPNSFHVEWSVRALEAGKHVLCEKPLARRPEEVERAFDAADRAGRVLMEAFMYRHHPQTKAVADLVAGGTIGRLRAIGGVFSFPLLARDLGDVRLRPELEGGSLMDLGCYCVSGARLLAGEPERVSAEQVTGESGVDVGLHGTLRFANDVVAQFRSSFALPDRQGLEVVGEEGTILVSAPWRIDAGGDAFLHRGDAVEKIDVGEHDSYRLQLENFAAAIDGREPPLLGRDDALGQARTIDALYRAAAEGRAVEL